MYFPYIRGDNIYCVLLQLSTSLSVMTRQWRIEFEGDYYPILNHNWNNWLKIIIIAE